MMLGDINMGEAELMVRGDFPVLNQKKGGDPLVYLDSGATTQKPQSVIDAVTHYYQTDNASVHRGVYDLSEHSTAAFEGVRQKVQQFIGARHAHEIIFTKGTTESINLVAHSFGQILELKPGDEIILSAMEHHANIVPWQMLCKRTGATIKVISLFNNGELDIAAFEALVNENTKLISVTHVSNVLGTINPIKRIIAKAKSKKIPVMIDGAQAVAHVPVDVADLGCDFYAFSAHKLYGPTGVGVLYAKEKWLKKMPPFQTGGAMIRTVSFEETTFGDLPLKFEPGTPNIAGVIGLGAAIDYVVGKGFGAIMAHEKALVDYANKALASVPGLTIYGSAPHKIAVFSFTMESAHPHDIATILNDSNIAVRAGHHCAMPLMTLFDQPALTRASFGIYSNFADVDALVVGLNKVNTFFTR